ncbi:hypothetical protein LCGC14_2839330 [marine sediment metagenome]|uniref:Uncharacterized protein n=1 Tax=marine sediment metagenome TaxID=412755 RepID=A0A0F8YBQ5_9ZZZZ
MNLDRFDELMEQKPFQYRPEWWMFLSICELYLKRYKIEKPIVVELGSQMGRQKRFWKQLFNAEHIGIDVTDERGVPDILGDTQDPKTLEVLKERLQGRSINILFIDACHYYGAVKRDFQIYSPLCSDIVALHDIESYRYKDKKIIIELFSWHHTLANKSVKWHQTEEGVKVFYNQYGYKTLVIWENELKDEDTLLRKVNEIVEETKMYEEVKLGAEMHKFVVGVPVEGVLTDKRTEVGKNESNVYTVGEKTFWGTSALDLLMAGIKEGSKLRITLTDENYKFPSGRVGKNFKVEVDK